MSVARVEEWILFGWPDGHGTLMQSPVADLAYDARAA
jgi:hypothetical protein